ncbi:MAG: class I SAM-dependent methyltransferase [Bacteroidia bacterium]
MIWHIQQYLLHRWRAQGKKPLRSPFVFDFYQNVVKAPSNQDIMGVAGLARKLKKDKTIIQRKDFGAGHGGKGGGVYSSTVGETARRSSRKQHEGRLLHHLVRHYQPGRMLELGSHLGISALYQATAMAPEARFISLEGDPGLAQLASGHLAEYGCNQVELITGPFSETLPALNIPAYCPDYVFIDGDHRYEPTVHYVQLILPHMPANAILILDDIYWSKGMARAWNEIRQSEKLTLTIDLFHFGLGFVNLEGPKEHICL